MAIYSNLTLGVVAGFLLAATLPLCAAPKGTLNIGHITTLTGLGAYIGPAAAGALEDEAARINAAGGINGWNLKIITYDGAGHAADNVAVAKRLIDQDKCVAIVGPTFSGAAIPIAKIADESHVPVIATTATNVNVTVDESGKVHPYMFRVCFIDPYQGTALADYAYNKLGKRKAAFISDVGSPYTVALHQFFKDRFTMLGGQVVTDEGYNTGEQEFRAQLATVRSSKPDVLVVCADNFKDPGLIAKQAKSLNFNIQMMGGDGWMVADIVPFAGKDLDGAYFTTIASVDDPHYADFNADFKKKHNGTAPNIWSYLNLDCLKIIENAIKVVTADGGAPDPAKLRDVIESTKDLPAFTCKFTFDKSTHNPYNKPVVMMQIKDNQLKVIESYAPKS
jgi:branched-chain amino acid transport system substrate-binding protein